MRWLYAIIDLILYGNFWIAGCAFAITALSSKLLGAETIWTPQNLIVFGGTLFIYGLHRTVGISRLPTFLEEKRYRVIYRFRNHIKIYALLGLLIAGYNFFQLSWNAQLGLIIPCLLSLGYVLPMLSKKKRLRDINDIKIFLIAVCWSWLTVGIPAIEMNVFSTSMVWWLIIERIIFIFLITLPFDIRDLRVDDFKSVRTIPMHLGESGTRRLGVGIFLALCGLLGLAFYQEWIATSTALIFLTGYFAALLLLWNSHSERHDYYYTGLVDGLMLLLALPLLFIL